MYINYILSSYTRNDCHKQVVNSAHLLLGNVSRQEWMRGTNVVDEREETLEAKETKGSVIPETNNGLILYMHETCPDVL